MRYLIVDGMLSGTGVRDGVVGEYLDPESIELSADLAKRIANWLAAYESAHYRQFGDEVENNCLDQEGIAIAMCIREEFPENKVEYFSNALMRKLPF